MGDKIEADYQVLQQIASKFRSESAEVTQLASQTRQKADQLIATGWKGRGADTFAAEMNGRILPALGKLVKALNEAGAASSRISQTFRNAEEECKSYMTAQ